MKSYSVSVPGFLSIVVEVKADTPEEAGIKAMEAAHFSVCHQCSKGLSDWSPDDDSDPDIVEIKVYEKKNEK